MAIRIRSLASAARMAFQLAAHGRVAVIRVNGLWVVKAVQS